MCLLAEQQAAVPARPAVCLSTLAALSQAQRYLPCPRVRLSRAEAGCDRGEGGERAESGGTERQSGKDSGRKADSGNEGERGSWSGSSVFAVQSVAVRGAAVAR
jgi:hypothetical protein